MNEMTTIAGAISIQDAVAFVWHEADLLDRKDYGAWLSLWSEEGHYVIPIDPDTSDFAGSLNVAYDDAEMRRMRVERLQGGFSISSAPPAQTVRTSSRFVVENCDGDEMVLRSAQHLVEDKFGRQRVFAANVTHHLVRTESGLRLKNKVVRLLNSDGILTSISYLF